MIQFCSGCWFHFDARLLLGGRLRLGNRLLFFESILSICVENAEAALEIKKACYQDETCYHEDACRQSEASNGTILTLKL